MLCVELVGGSRLQGKELEVTAVRAARWATHFPAAIEPTGLPTHAVHHSPLGLHSRPSDCPWARLSWPVATLPVTFAHPGSCVRRSASCCRWFAAHGPVQQMRAWCGSAGGVVGGDAAPRCFASSVCRRRLRDLCGCFGVARLPQWLAGLNVGNVDPLCLVGT